MQQQFSEEFWNPTRAGYMASVGNLKAELEKKRDRESPMPEEVGRSPQDRGWARTQLGKVLTSDKFRLSSKEAYEKYWTNVRRTMHSAELALARIKRAGFPPSRETVYNALLHVSFRRPIDIAFRDGKLRFPPGAWVCDLNELAAICDLHPDTVRVALRDLATIEVIHFTSTWNGTIIQIVGFYVNRPTNPHVSVRRSWPAIEASLHMVPSEKPPPKRGEHTPESRRHLDYWNKHGRPPPE